MKPIFQVVSSFSEEPKNVEMLLFKNYIRNMIITKVNFLSESRNKTNCFPFMSCVVFNKPSFWCPLLNARAFIFLSYKKQTNKKKQKQKQKHFMFISFRKNLNNVYLLKLNNMCFKLWGLGKQTNHVPHILRCLQVFWLLSMSECLYKPEPGKVKLCLWTTKDSEAWFQHAVKAQDFGQGWKTQKGHLL